ncbi:MAG: helix-turn-helix transcriptional regulator [Faecalimonas sp.]|nr:helix-turn-helix transcriptional regulator [Faecalimonas sp.]
MRIFGKENNEIILKEMGIRIKDIRIANEMTQKELAMRAGIAPRTVERIENGENVKVENILHILRAMNLLQNLENLVPEQNLRPTDLHDCRKKRVRATSRRQVDYLVDWKWGDEE